VNGAATGANVGTTRRSEIRMLAIPACVRGDLAVLLDRKGRRLCGVRLDRLGPISEELTSELLWHYAAKAMTFRYAFVSLKQCNDPWLKRARSLSASYRLRRHDRSYQGGRKQFDRYPTHTWSDAAKRMVQQAYNRFRRRDRSGWVLWSHTVSSNQNKRAESRYGGR
jgi:hypothetical protein